MTKSTDNNNETLKIRIFALLVFVIMISSAAIVMKCNKHKNHNSFSKFERFNK